MAKYNYWEAGGMLVSYAPMPASVRTVLSPGDYIFRFKAKSEKGAVVRATDEGNVSFISNFALTNELREYEAVFTKKTSVAVGLWDLNLSGDIVIQDIQLVEKPRGRATINGIDGFLSGKWNLSPRAKVIDNETLELQTTGAFDLSYLDMTLEPNTDYVFVTEAYGTNSRSSFRAGTSTGAGLGTINSGSGTFSFKSPADGKVSFRLDNNGDVTGGKLTFKRPMLILGSTPVPYEPKRGERMVLPQVAGKNLIDLTRQAKLSTAPNWNNDYMEAPNEFSFYGFVSSGGPQRFLTKEEVDLIKGKTVTVSAGFLQNANVNLICKNAADVTILNDASLNSSSPGPKTYNIPAESAVIYFNLSTRNGNNGDRTVYRNMQIEEGSATPFEPYRVRTTRKATKNTVIGKNLFDKSKATSGMFINTGTGVPAASGLGQSISDFIPVSPSTPYVGSGIKSAPASSGGIGLAYYSQSLVYVGGLSYDQGKALGTFTTPANAAFVRITFMGADMDSVQLEPGAVATAYEPFRLGLRKATKVPAGKNLFSVAHLAYQFWTAGNQNALYAEYTLKPNTAYTLSSNVPVTATANLYYNGSGTAGYGVMNGIPKTFTTGADGKLYVAVPNSPYREHTAKLLDGTYWIQLEEGTAATAFEPFRSGPRPAPKGLELNGTNALVSVPNPHNSPISKLDISIDLIPGTLQTEQALIAIEGAFKLDLTAGRNPRFLTGDNWGSTPSVGKPLPSGRLVRIRATFDGTSKKIYMDDNVGESSASGVIPTPNQTYSLSFGARNATPTTFVSFFAGVVLRAKVVINDDRVFDYDFTNPGSIMGTKVKAKNGPDATIGGNPIQLNRQARR